ncbi:MAG: arginine deiminase family protein [Pseudomonadota bacterium]|nr:arginine deiminase family protein [Pseudomonadota bacterium]
MSGPNAAAFTRALVRRPGSTFASGLTSAAGPPPDLIAAGEQHLAYCAALRETGLIVSQLAPELQFPDGTFVEDTAIVTARGAILTRPGAPSRTGEVESVAVALRAIFPQLPAIQAPGTLDGGDVCEADGRFLIGLSTRTNESGAAQLADFLTSLGYEACVVDIRTTAALLHLKTGLAYIGDDTWVMTRIARQVVPLDGFAARRVIDVPEEEAYAANCVRVNDSVLVPARCPRVIDALRTTGHRILALDMSEFKKMDGGLSCLSLRF